MKWQDVVIWFGPAFAWVAIWTQFVTFRFFEKNESLFKDLVSSGVKDLALSHIDEQELIPALAKLCDCVSSARKDKDSIGVLKIQTEELLLEVDFLPHLSGAERALREKKSIEDMLADLQRRCAVLWKISLIHTFSVVLLPTALLIDVNDIKLALISGGAVSAIVTLGLLIHGTIAYQSTRDTLFRKLALYRKV